MSRPSPLLITKCLLLAGVVPILLYAYSAGPYPFRTGAPGDAASSGGSGNCLDSGCHSSSFALNKGPGSVAIISPNGNSYVPGVSQQIMVTISDSTKVHFGFELSARLASASTTQAGSFSTTDSLTQVICSDGRPKGTGCPSQFPLEFIEHTAPGTSSAGSYTFQLSWTPPATNVGNVTFYVAGNAGPAADVQTSADVYTTSVTLTPAASTSGGPAITNGGIVPVYSTSTIIQPGSWFSIYGSNLAASTSVWNGDFPQTLGGTSVTVNNKPAYLWFVSAGQINAQAPDDTATGSVPVTVTSGGATATSTVTLAKAGPAFLLLDAKHITGIILTPNGSGSQGGGTYDFLGPTSAGAGFRPAKAGENIALYGVGFGTTNPTVAAGKAFSGAASLVTPAQLTVGGVAVNVAFGGLISAGLYQFNFVVPANAGTGDVALLATVNGVQTQSGLVIPLQ